MANSVNEKIEAIATAQTATADELRGALAALAGQIGTLATAIATKPGRATRGSKAPVAQLSEPDRAANAGGFRRGERAQLVKELVRRGPGVYGLGEVCGQLFGSDYPIRNGVPVAQAIARRLTRLPNVGYTLVVDVDEADFGKTELDFQAREKAETTEAPATQE